MGLSMVEFIEFVNCAVKKEQEERIYFQWVSRLPKFQDAKYCDFNYYYGLVSGQGIDTRSPEEIIKDIEETHRKVGNEWTFSN